MTTEPATVTSADDGDRLLVAGELDAEGCPTVRDAVVEAVARCAEAPDAAPIRPCLLDLSDVTFVASAGLSLLLELDARATASGVALLLVVPPDTPLAQQLERTGLDSQLAIRPTADDD